MRPKDAFLNSLLKGLGYGISIVITFALLACVLEIILSSDWFSDITDYLWKYVVQ